MTTAASPPSSLSRPAPPGPGQMPKIYECPECGERQLQRRCPDCNLLTRRLGHGGLCPHCDEPVTLTDLAETT